MDRPFNEALLEHLGSRYRLGDRTDDGVELRYRFGKAEFRPSRIVIVEDGDQRALDLRIDVRVPDGHAIEEADGLVETLEGKSLTPRGFERTSNDVQAMTSESGKAAGHVRTLTYRAQATTPQETGDRVRAIVETLDIPIVVGIHEPRDVIAKKPLPPPKKKGASMPHDPMEVWTYTLAGGVMRSLNVVIDPNVRTLEVVERKLLSKKQLGETLKLAHVAKFLLTDDGNEVKLYAEKREGERVLLAEGLSDAEFTATAKRMADKVFITIEAV